MGETFEAGGVAVPMVGAQRGVGTQGRTAMASSPPSDTQMKAQPVGSLLGTPAQHHPGIG